MQVHHLLENAATAYPEKQALWYQDIWYTYGQIEKETSRISLFLQNLGLEKGSRIAVLLDNSFHYVISYFAVLKSGFVVVGLNTDTNSDSLSYLLNDSDSSVIITQKKYWRLLYSAIPECPTLSTVLLMDGETEEDVVASNVEVAVFKSLTGGEECLSVRTIDIDLAEIVYTSGSTGKPKGVMLSHLNLVSNMKSICSYLHLNVNDRIMVVLPFFYIYGKSLLLTHFMIGASVVIDNRFVFPNKVLETMRTTGVTGFAGVPSTFMILLNRSTIRSTPVRSLRYITQAGGSMAPSVQKDVMNVFSPAELFIMYGATEAAPRLSYLDPAMLESKLGSIGVPVDNVDLLICDSDGKELPIGEVGEIAARGSNIMSGYWKDPVETAKVLRHGLYFTGDLGKKDEEGYFFVVGRTKEMIKVKGFRVGTKEIEEAILELEKVHETAVIGIPDPILGEAILALVIPKEKGWDGKDLIRSHLQKTLSSIKQPKYIEFRDSFLKNESGKILKNKLKEIESKINREN